MYLPTKLFPPPLSSHLVIRNRLLQKLTLEKPRALTLVSAPAGFGKSTLLAEWMAEGQVKGEFQYGWLSLDASENALDQFWGYFAAAWQATLPSGTDAPEPYLERIQILLKTDEARIAEEVVNLIIHGMLSVPAPVMIVLDDYHQIQNPEIHAGIAQLIERLPAHVHLAIATRSDPPLPIPRLRVREQITEIRASDLRFTEEEIDLLFERIPGIAYHPADIPIIAASTEGWVAGLKMAVLALQAQERSAEDTRQFWAAFNGRNVYILDYLTEEVLGHLPEEMQIFLMKTAVLDRLNDRLCAAVVFDDSPSVGRASAILDRLDRSNLFLIPLDQERRWFRYHHLFVDLLRVRLQQRLGEQIPKLHRRAADWYEQENLIEEAMQHRIAAQDWPQAARIIESYGNAYLDHGQLAIVLKWVEALPETLLRRRPNLCIQMAWALGHAGRTHQVGPMLREADAALALWEQQQQGLPVDPPIQITERDAVCLRGSLAFFRAYALILSAQPDQALALVQHTLASLGTLEPREDAWLHWVAGYACRGLGKIEQAIGYFQQAVELGRAGGQVWVDHATDWGIAYWLSGRLERAAKIMEEALQDSERQGQQNKGNLSRVEVYLSAIRMEQNRIEVGLEHARKGVEYLQWWPSHNHISTAYGFSGLAFLALGAFAQAEAAIGMADQEHRKGEVTPFVIRLIEQARVRLWIAQGNLAQLKHWVEAQRVDLPDDPATHPLNEYEETRLITLCRALVTLGRCESEPERCQKAIHILTGLAISAEAIRRMHASIEIRLLGALAYWELARQEQGGTIEALDWLTRSLADGLPNGYCRVYLNEGEPIRNLLRAWLGRDREWLAASGVSLPAAYALFEQMGDALNGTGRSRLSAGLVEPLTERERDVLSLLALGLSNREIAEKMVVSEGTIKTHMHNLIGKLGVQSRAQVLVRAKELKLFG